MLWFIESIWVYEKYFMNMVLRFFIFISFYDLKYNRIIVFSYNLEEIRVGYRCFLKLYIKGGEREI